MSGDSFFFVTLFLFLSDLSSICMYHHPDQDSFANPLPPPPRLFPTFYIPPLYLPRKFLHCGHLWVTELRLSMQQGMQAQTQRPTTQRTPERIQARGPGSESVLVRTWLWQCGHVIWTGWGPKVGALTYCTMTGCWAWGAGAAPWGGI